MLIWIAIGLVVVTVLGVLEWRSQKKPLPTGLSSHWSVHDAATNESRSISGGHDI